MNKLLISIVFILCSLASHSQKPTPASCSYAIGLPKADIIKALGYSYTIKSNENGSAFLEYSFDGFKQTFYLNSSGDCYYGVCWLDNDFVYLKAMELLNKECKWVSNATWVNDGGVVIQAKEDKYPSGTIYTLTFR